MKQTIRHKLLRGACTGMCGLLALSTMAGNAMLSEKASGRSGTREKRGEVVFKNTRLGEAERNRVETPVGKRTGKAGPRMERKARGEGGMTGTERVKMPSRADMPEKAGSPSGYVPQLYGSVTYSNLMGNPYVDYPVGLYEVASTADGYFEKVFAGPDASLGGVVKDGVYYCANMEDYVFIQFFHLYAYDMTTGELIATGEVRGDISCMGAGGWSVDPVSGDIYGITFNASGESFQLSKLDFSIEGKSLKCRSTRIGGITERFNSFAIDSSGQFYGVRYDMITVPGGEMISGSSLCKIDRNTAAVTLVGSTGYAPAYYSSAAIDPETDRMFWTVSPQDETGWLMEIDLATGKAVPVCQYENAEEITGLYVGGHCNQQAPAGLKEVSVAFEADSQTGTVKATAPSMLVDGSAAGVMELRAYAGGTLVGSMAGVGSGSTVEFPVTMAEPGLYTFRLVAANANGEGPASKVPNLYVGKDVPRTPEVTLTYTDGTMNVSWTKVTGGAHNGYLDASRVKYRVERLESDKAEPTVVAASLNTLKFSESIVPENKVKYYRYRVTATADGRTGEGGISQAVKTGDTVYPPFESIFAAGVDGYRSFDGNGDGRKWVWLEQLNSFGISYHETNNMDDWLITPVIHLEEGEAYPVTVLTHCERRMDTERIEIKAGRQNTVAAMTIDVMEPETVEWEKDDIQPLGGVLVAREAGDYYLGFHAVSPKNSNALYLTGWSIGTGTTAYAPAAPTGLTVTPDAAFALKATVKFKVPETDMLGNPLESVSGVTIYRDGEVVKSFRQTDAGTELEYTDELPGEGTFQYSVRAQNRDGVGREAKASVLVGIPLPGDLGSVSIERTATDGEVKLSWPAVSESEDGRPMDQSMVKYNIYTFNNLGLEMLIAEDVEGTEYVFQAIRPGRQDFVQCSVYPVTTRGEGNGLATEMIPVGTAYQGLEEDFADGYTHYSWGLTSSGNNVAYGVYTTTDTGIEAAGNDNGFFAIQGSKPNDYCDLFTGLVTLEGMEDPGVSVYVLNQGSDSGVNDNENLVQIWVREADHGEYTVLKSVPLNQSGPVGAWNFINADLSAYSGQRVQVLVRCIIKTHSIVCFDNISVRTMPPHDMAAVSLEVPAKVKTGTSYPVAVTVHNRGTKLSGDYTVKIIADGSEAGAADATALTAGDRTVHTVMVDMHPLATEAVTLKAVVSYDADGNPANNETGEVTLEPVPSVLPDVEGLSGMCEEGSVKLTWNAPCLDPVAEEETEGFENAESFADSYGDWIFVDKDGAELGGISGLTIPGLSAGATGSFRIWDQAQLGNATYAAHSGTKYIFSMYRDDDDTVNDWAITPELDGSEQTITFWAKSYHEDYPEKIRLYYSDGSTEPDDFTLAKGSLSTVPAEWTLYSCTVPAGTKRFAIRSCAKGAFMLMIDDVTFTAKATQPLEAEHYNVYRDGAKVNGSPVGTGEFSDADVEEGKSYTYTVTTRFKNRGESKGCDPIEVFVQSSGATGAGLGGSDVTVKRHTIVAVTPAGERVTVVSADGKVLYKGSGKRETRVEVGPGVYAVRAGGLLRTVIVK